MLGLPSGLQWWSLSEGSEPDLHGFQVEKRCGRHSPLAVQRANISRFQTVPVNTIMSPSLRPHCGT